MPFKEGSHNWRHQKEFLELIGPISKEIGASTLDFTDSIESDRFIDSSHFNEKGHQEFGKLMMEAIRNELR
jgi:lysophospholipase L1-like esterase